MHEFLEPCNEAQSTHASSAKICAAVQGHASATTCRGEPTNHIFFCSAQGILEHSHKSKVQYISLRLRLLPAARTLSFASEEAQVMGLRST